MVEQRVHEVRLRAAYRLDPGKGRSSGHGAVELHYCGSLLGRSSDGILAAARILLKRNLADPEDVVQTVWDDTGMPSMRAKVGVAAKWTVSETGRRSAHFRRFRPGEADAVLIPEESPQVFKASGQAGQPHGTARQGSPANSAASRAQLNFDFAVPIDLGTSPGDTSPGNSSRT
jgi:hypothetical protein